MRFGIKDRTAIAKPPPRAEGHVLPEEIPQPASRALELAIEVEAGEVIDPLVQQAGPIAREPAGAAQRRVGKAAQTLSQIFEKPRGTVFGRTRLQGANQKGESQPGPDRQ